MFRCFRTSTISAAVQRAQRSPASQVFLSKEYEKGQIPSSSEWIHNPLIPFVYNGYTHSQTPPQPVMHDTVAPSTTRAMWLHCDARKNVGSRSGSIFVSSVQPFPCSLVPYMQQRHYTSRINTFYKFVERAVKGAVANINQLRIHFFTVLLGNQRGTLIIICRGEGIDGIYLGGDGVGWLPWFGGKIIPAKQDNEKVIVVNDNVIVAAMGTSLFFDHIIKLLKAANIKSASECSCFVDDFMNGSPYENLMAEMNKLEKLRTLINIAVFGKEYLEDFSLYFASSNELAYYDGQHGVVIEDLHPEGTAEGMCEKSAISSLATSKKLGFSVEKSMMIAFTEAYHSSTEYEAVGGRIVIRKVSSKGISLVWDGDIKDMIKQHLQDHFPE